MNPLPIYRTLCDAEGYIAQWVIVCTVVPALEFCSSSGTCFREFVLHHFVALSAVGEMAGIKVAALSVCLLVVLAMVAETHAATCNANALYPCLAAIEGANPPWPSRACCNVVKAADKNCMCNQLRSSSFPAQLVKNGLKLPKKCGRTDLGGYKCGRYTFPY